MRPTLFCRIKARAYWFVNFIVHRFKIQRTLADGKKYVTVICYGPVGVKWVRTFSVNEEYDRQMEPIPFVADIDTGSNNGNQTFIQS